MRQYQVSVAADPDGNTLQLRSYIDGWHDKHRTWDWLPLNTWTAPTGTSLPAALNAALTQGGWRTEDPLPEQLPATINVIPLSRLALLTTIQSTRAELAEKAATADAALANLLADLPPATDEGHISPTALASKLGITRSWLFRIEANLADAIAKAWPTMDPTTRTRATDQLADNERAKLPTEPSR